jgi:transcription elongation factor Elf1
VKHRLERAPICPYCNTEYELEGNIRDEWATLQCPACDKRFHTETYVSVEYSSVGDCKLNDELPHEMAPTIYSKSFRCSKCFTEAYDWQLPDGKHPRFNADEVRMIDSAKEESA